MRRFRKAALVLLLVAVAAEFAATATGASFLSLAQNAGNSFSSGTVFISDNDAGASMLALSNARPGDSSSGCIKVVYGGTLDSSLTIYAGVSGALASYISVQVIRGVDSSPSFSSCTNFTADATNYMGAGAGVVYSGLLSALPASYATGIVDPVPGSPETWTTSEAHSYRIVATLMNNGAAQGLSSTASFTWEARNL